jgi:hypothetical protein
MLLSHLQTKSDISVRSRYAYLWTSIGINTLLCAYTVFLSFYLSIYLSIFCLFANTPSKHFLEFSTNHWMPKQIHFKLAFYISLSLSLSLCFISFKRASTPFLQTSPQKINSKIHASSDKGL